MSILDQGAALMNIGDNSKAQLKNLVDRIENIEIEIGGLQEDRKTIYQEAKDAGVDTKALKAVIRIRKQNATERETHETIVQSYLAALGDYASTELGKAAITRIGG